jgi:hypothetical protein
VLMFEGSWCAETLELSLAWVVGGVQQCVRYCMLSATVPLYAALLLCYLLLDLCAFACRLTWLKSCCLACLNP